MKAAVARGGYFDYFGTQAGPRGRGYYTFKAGTWRVFALDSTVCEDGGCARGSAQFTWLRKWLKRDRSRCVIASWHHPPFSSGRHGNNDDVRPLVSLLYNAGAEIVVAGHDHDYERFAPLRPSGERDAKHGIRSFVVGTGGTWLREIPGERTAGSQAVNADTHGVLRLRLRPGSYDWRFLPAGAGTFTDAGRGTCHGRPS